MSPATRCRYAYACSRRDNRRIVLAFAGRNATRKHIHFDTCRRMYKCSILTLEGDEAVMMKKSLIFVCLLLALVLVAAPISAHEGREVGEYVLVFGWRVEPAYAGIYNGPELTIEHHDTDEPLTGAEATLQLMVHFGDQQKMLELYPVWNEPGHYTADLIPTRPGDYSFHLFGTLGDTEVDEMFSSADGEFSTIEPAADIQFPAPESDTAALQEQIDALRAELDALKAAQSS